MNYGFEKYEIIDIFENMQKEFEIDIEKGKADNYKLIINGNFKMPILSSKKDKIVYKYKIYDSLMAPVMGGEKIGEIVILIENNIIKKFNVYMPETLEKKGILDYFKKISKFELKNYEIRL